MIPKKKKSPEEIAALREGLGIPEAPQDSPAKEKQISTPEPLPVAEKQDSPPSQDSEISPPRGNGGPQTEEDVVHLDPEDTPPAPKRREPKIHSLRKRELPLAPAPVTGFERTELPQHRHGSREIAEIRKRAALSSLPGQNTDPAAHLKRMTAHPVLLIPAYLITLGAAFSSWRSSEYFTPLILLAISSLMAAYIHLVKKRSRHHSAILVVIILMTAAFGSLRYFPIF